MKYVYFYPEGIADVKAFGQMIAEVWNQRGSINDAIFNIEEGRFEWMEDETSGQALIELITTTIRTKNIKGQVTTEEL